MRAGSLLFFFWAVSGFAAFNLTWGVPAVSLDSNPPVGDADLSPTIAIDPLGNAVATWSRTTGHETAEDVWAASYHQASRTWTGALLISGGGSACRSVVGMDREGDAVIVWEEGFPTQIFSRTLSAAGVWSPPLSLPPVPVCHSLYAQECAQIAVDPDGDALVIWMESVAGKNTIRSARKPVGSDWISLGELSLKGAQAVLSPPTPLAMNTLGDAAAVWQQSHAIYGAQYVKGTWTQPIFIASGTQPSVGIGGTGRVLFVWNEGNVIRSRILSEGILAEAVNVSNPLLTAARPCVALDDAGNGVVVYERLDGAAEYRFITSATLSKSGTSWSSPVDLSAPSPARVATAGYPKLRLNGSGDGVAIWKEFDGAHMLVQGAGYSFGTWSFVRTLSSAKDNAGAPFPSYDMAIALNLAGNIMAVWPEDPSGKNTQHIKAAPGGQNSRPFVPETPIATGPGMPADEKTSHIKVMPGVGIAVMGPLPPMIASNNVSLGIGSGFQVRHRFPAHSDLINIIDWGSPGGVAYFKIYRGNLSSLIATTNKTHYEDHSRPPKERTTYFITSVDNNGYESVPITIVVQP